MDEGQVSAISDGFERIETHVSWLLMDKEHVYKIKKPLRFSFLDFSTMELREFYCREEVRLNSRLSPDVYLGVVPIAEEDGTLRIEGRGRAIDHAVKMVRLDQGRRMDLLLKEDNVGADEVRTIAGMVASFHERAEIARGGFGSPAMIASQIGDLGNFREAIEKASGLGRWVDSILLKSSAFMKRNDGLLRRRAGGGFVRDCHGDLHTANVFLTDPIRAIDCIEFNADFRCIDVASDIAFMAMDLEYAGRDDLSETFVGEYLSRTGDKDAEALLQFYKCYRANVRAKIAAIEWLQKPADEPRERIDRYVLLAERYAKEFS
ncbi:MAG: hypothetical protein U0R44_04350 [Candidatus Micrarchaeia archaeon]